MLKHNFSAGPCVLPQEVFKKAADAVLNFNDLSILEISHRSKDFVLKFKVYVYFANKVSMVGGTEMPAHRLSQPQESYDRQILLSLQMR